MDNEGSCREEDCSCTGFRVQLRTERTCEYCDHDLQEHGLTSIMSFPYIDEYEGVECDSFIFDCPRCKRDLRVMRPTCYCGTQIEPDDECTFCGYPASLHQLSRCHIPGCPNPPSQENLSKGMTCCDEHYCPSNRCIEPNCFFKAIPILCHKHMQCTECKLFLIPKDHPKYKDIKSQFVTSWRHDNKAVPTDIEIFFVSNSDEITMKYNLYLNTVIATRPVCYRHAGPGNVLRRWHGPSGLNCTDLSKGVICKDPTCATCNILRFGLQMKYIGTRKATDGMKTTGWNRFGAGLYFTSTSSKAHDYAAGVEKNLGNGRRCMFLSQVVCGKPKEVKADDGTLSQQRLDQEGCHSVVAHGKVDNPNKGGESVLNYDEVVVFKDESSLIRYLVIYK